VVKELRRLHGYFVFVPADKASNTTNSIVIVYQVSCRMRYLYHHMQTMRGLIDWLIIYGFTSRSRIFHLYGDVTIAGEGLQNLDLWSALGAFEQGGIFIVPHLLWHETSVFPVSFEGPPHLVASYDIRGVVEDLL
jgi:hypothetical protein